MRFLADILRLAAAGFVVCVVVATVYFGTAFVVHTCIGVATGW